jgi:hypothetical protein
VELSVVWAGELLGAALGGIDCGTIGVRYCSGVWAKE